MLYPLYLMVSWQAQDFIFHPMRTNWTTPFFQASFKVLAIAESKLARACMGIKICPLLAGHFLCPQGPRNWHSSTLQAGEAASPAAAPGLELSSPAQELTLPALASWVLCPSSVPSHSCTHPLQAGELRAMIWSSMVILTCLTIPCYHSEGFASL